MNVIIIVNIMIIPADYTYPYENDVRIRCDMQNLCSHNTFTQN